MTTPKTNKNSEKNMEQITELTQNINDLTNYIEFINSILNTEEKEILRNELFNAFKSRNEHIRTLQSMPIF